MDGIENKCPFIKLNEIDAWEKAKTSEDFYLALFAGLLTDFDLRFLQRNKIWGIDDRR